MPPLAHTALAASIVLSALGAVIVCLLTALYGFTPEEKERPARAARRRLLTRVGHVVATACFAGTAILLTVVLALTARSSSTTSPDARVPALDAKIDAHMQRLQGVEQRMKDSEQALERLETEVSEGAVRSMAPEAAPAVIDAPRPAEQPRPVSAAKPAPRPRAAIVPVKPPAKAAPSAPKPAERPAPAAAPPPPVTPATERAVAPAPIDEPAASPAPPPVTTPPPTPSRPSSMIPGAATPATNTREQTPAPDFLSKLRNDWRSIQHGWDSAGEDFRRALAPLRGSN